ncbi:MAG: hypothetical protein D6714_01115 [Bacteroidetes bacterium]|nr:MAG: hypothetical protein D6714_01115 [Bacteroidota bacterium]
MEAVASMVCAFGPFRRGVSSKKGTPVICKVARLIQPANSFFQRNPHPQKPERQNLWPPAPANRTIHFSQKIKSPLLHVCLAWFGFN